MTLQDSNKHTAFLNAFYAIIQASTLTEYEAKKAALCNLNQEAFKYVKETWLDL